MAFDLFTHGFDPVSGDGRGVVTPVLILADISDDGGYFLITEDAPPGDHGVVILLVFDGDGSLKAVQDSANDAARLGFLYPLRTDQRWKLSGRPSATGLMAGDTRWLVINPEPNLQRIRRSGYLKVCELGVRAVGSIDLRMKSGAMPVKINGSRIEEEGKKDDQPDGESRFLQQRLGGRRTGRSGTFDRLAHFAGELVEVALEARVIGVSKTGVYEFRLTR